jgi:galactokinase
VSTPARAAAAFVRTFGVEPLLCWAPGRVNLLGDHIDYCGGAVLPMPIQFGTAVALRLRDDDRVRATSLNQPNDLDVRLAAASALPPGHWGRFVLGAHAVLRREGYDVGGADIVVCGDIPGSGLSSSASLAVALLYALTASSSRPLAGLPLARLAQRIEHQYVGVQCGLMDQAVVALGEPGRALWFDCFDHRHRAIRLPARLAVLVFDTGRSRQLARSAYNARLAETRAAAESLGIDRAGLARLGPTEWNARCDRLADEQQLRRARHVVTEAARVEAGCAALAAGDAAAFGRLLRDSHASLRDDYAVSCVELDALADALNAAAGCFGARMTGAGFGGCVVAAIDAAAVASVAAEASQSYRQRFAISPAWFVAESSGGVRLIDD